MKLGSREVQMRKVLAFAALGVAGFCGVAAGGTAAQAAVPAARADRAFRKGARAMIAWAGRCLWPTVWTVIRAVRMAHDQQVCMWECILLTSGAAPLTAAGPLRWVPSLDGYRLVGSHLPAHDPSETG